MITIVDSIYAANSIFKESVENYIVEKGEAMKKAYKKPEVEIKKVRMTVVCTKSGMGACKTTYR